MHPNEAVAVHMASAVAEELIREGRTVEIVDLENLRTGWGKPHWATEMSRNDTARLHLLMKALRDHEGEFFDWHDSPVEGLVKSFGTDRPTLELTRAGYYLVETPAEYVSQEDPQVSMHAEGERTVNRYFTRRSDVDASREAGFLSPSMVNELTQKIFEVVERRDAFE